MCLGTLHKTRFDDLKCQKYHEKLHLGDNLL
jgi:hypothetical protein